MNNESTSDILADFSVLLRTSSGVLSLFYVFLTLWIPVRVNPAVCEKDSLISCPLSLPEARTVRQCFRVRHFVMWPETLKLIQCDRGSQSRPRNVTMLRRSHHGGHGHTSIVWSQSVIKIGVDLCLDLWLSVLAHQILPGGIRP